MNLPSSVTAQPQIDDSFVVTIGAGGQLYFNEDEVNAAGVERRVREAYSKNPEVLGIIQADKVVPYSSIIEMIDLIRKSGVQNVSLAAALEMEK